MHLVLTYDVVNSRRRQRFFKRLKKFLSPVQKSVFEGPVPPRQLDAIERLVVRELDLETDTVLVYNLCRGCVGLRRALGVARHLQDPEAPILI